LKKHWKALAVLTLTAAMCVCVHGQQAESAQPKASSSQASSAPVTSESERVHARTTAQNILAQSEFRRLREPGLKEALSDKLVAALLRFFEKILGHAPDLSILSNVVVWGIVLIALVALSWWLWRASRFAFENPIPSMAAVGTRVSDIPWQEWLRMAKEAAQRGAFREAIHFGYWAGISAMEQRGAWKPDVARTPREYLSLVSKEQYTTLESLTRELERTWYAQQSATAADFQNCLAQLERLGCQ
jgi:hypothetical protein